MMEVGLVLGVACCAVDDYVGVTCLCPPALWGQVLVAYPNIQLEIFLATVSSLCILPCSRWRRGYAWRE